MTSSISTDMAMVQCSTCGIMFTISKSEVAQEGAGPFQNLECESCQAARANVKPAMHGPYATLGAEIGQLVETKQAAYGNSFGKAGDVLRALYPTGVPPEKFDDMLTLARMIDKMFRIATDRDALGESPYRDIAGYALLAVKRVEGKGGKAS